MALTFSSYYHQFFWFFELIWMFTTWLHNPAGIPLQFRSFSSFGYNKQYCNWSVPCGTELVVLPVLRQNSIVPWKLHMWVDPREFGANTTSTLDSCPDTDRVTTQQELDCGANTCGIDTWKGFRIQTRGTSSWRKSRRRCRPGCRMGITLSLVLT